MMYAILAGILIVAILLLQKKKNKEPDAPEKPILPTSIEEIKVPIELPVHWFENGVRKEGIAKMTQGLQVFDSNGVCILDITDRLTRIIDQITAPSAEYQIEKTYTVQAKQKLWWSLNSASDYFEVDPGNLLFGTIGANVDITYVSETSVKVKYHLSEKNDTVILGVY